MRQPTVQALVSLIVVGSLTTTHAAGPSIGIAMASGPFELNHSMVQGNASLFEGSEVRTGSASSKLRINGGTRLEIGTESAAKVYAARTVLERGAGQIEGNSAYRIEAQKMVITGTSPKSIARVQVDGEAVLVSAVNGPVKVSNDRGMTLAKVAAGMNLRFLQGGASDAAELSGCLLKKGGKPVLVDATLNQTFELRGAEQSKDFGNRVTLKGKLAGGNPTVQGAAQVVTVDSVTQLAPGGCLATAAAIGADPLEAAPAPATTAASPKVSAPPVAKPSSGESKSGGSNKAVLAGVIIGGGAAAGIGIALAGKSKSK